jgi:hypothetical protein
MNLFIPLFIVLFLFSTCQPRGLQEQEEARIDPSTRRDAREEATGLMPGRFVLLPGQAGLVQVGMRVEDLKAAVPAGMLVEKEIRREGISMTLFEVLNDSYSQETGLVAEPLCEPECRIYRIEVRDRKYQTPEGVGIGSTYGEVRRAYTISYATAEEGNVVAVAEEQRMSFLLDPGELDRQQLPRLIKADIPDSSLVTRILIF